MKTILAIFLTLPITGQTVETHGIISATSTNIIQWTGPRTVGRQKVIINVPTEILVNEAVGGVVSLKAQDTNQGAFTLQATTAPGYVFRGWKGDVGGDWITMTVVVRGQKVVTPVFEKDK